MALLRMLQGANAVRCHQTFGSVFPRASLATMKIVSAEDHKTEDFYKKNERLKRPTSPHLTIYKWQITASLSITHRFTGLFQSAFLSGAAVAAMTLPGTFPSYLMSLQGMHMGGACIFLAKFALAWPFAFHFLNGIRHLSWDMGWGFQLSDLYKTGYAVLALSLLLGVGLASV